MTDDQEQDIDLLDPDGGPDDEDNGEFIPTEDMEEQDKFFSTDSLTS